MTLQRYVSKELTHFVGRGLSEEGQYSILVDSILRGGWLRHSPNTTQEPAEILERGGVSLTIDRFAPLSEVYGPQVVCFCDIPVSDLEIHMRKYSRFGLSFLKPFLIEKGANPVYYVAENSRALKWFMGEEPKGVSGYAVTRKLLFEHNVREYIDLFWKLRMGDNPPQWDTGLLVPFPEEHEKIGLLQLLLDSYVF